MDGVDEYKPALLAMLMMSALVATAGVRADEDETDDDGAAPVAQILTGAGRTLEIPVQIQRQAGLEVAILEGVEQMPERETQALVVDVAPLLQMRGQYFEALALRDSARAALARARAGLQRLESLQVNPDDVSARQMLEVRTTLDETEAQMRAADARCRTIEESLARDWGPGVAARARDPGAGDLFSGQVLLLVAAPDGTAELPHGGVRVAATGATAGSIPVEIVGAAPLAGDTLPGAAWFGLARAGGFRVGSHVMAWIPLASAPVRGVRVPRAAVIWHGGTPWIYLRMGATQFARRAIAAGSDLGAHWFVPAPALAGADVVVSGAQTLLSEELRAQIPDEDDDP